MRNAFTLIELLVVVAIISILLALVVPRIGKTIANAREQTCRANLKNLQAACISYATECGSSGGNAVLPFAGSHEVYDLLSDTWSEKPGWIRWLGDGSWGVRGKGPQRSIMRSGGISYQKSEANGGNTPDAIQAIKNGTIFEYTNKELGTYRCPMAAKALEKQFGSANYTLTYKMNGFFYFLGSPSWQGRVLSWIGTKEGIAAEIGGESSAYTIPEANRLMLFAETTGNQIAPAKSGKKEDDCDQNKNCTIHVPYSAKDQTERYDNATLGAYHYGPSKREMWALAIFLDGHIEKLNPSTEDEDEVTMTYKNRAWYLCNGLEADPAGKTLQ